MTPFEKTPRNPLPAGFRPANGMPWHVQDGDDWAKIAALHGVDARTLIQFNFQTTDPAEVNFYLRTVVGCSISTFDGRNWKFAASDSPGIIYIPPKFNYSIRLPVPHVPGTKPNSCWHDSARMIFQFKKGSDIDPMSAAWKADTGLSAADFSKLAQQLGLKPINVPMNSLTPDFLADALRRYGPVWAAGIWNGVNHVVVIAGIDANGNVYVNDPAKGVPRVETFDWFNERLYRTGDLQNSLLYLP